MFQILQDKVAHTRTHTHTHESNSMKNLKTSLLYLAPKSGT